MTLQHDRAYQNGRLVMDSRQDLVDEIERLRRALIAVRPMVDLQGMNIIDEALDAEYRAILQAKGFDVYEGLNEQLTEPDTIRCVPVPGTGYKKIQQYRNGEWVDLDEPWIGTADRGDKRG